MEYSHLLVNGKKYKVPQFNGFDYISLSPDIERKSYIEVDKIYNSTWDTNNFNTSRSPYFVHTIENRKGFSLGGDMYGDINVLDMPIKFPKRDEYYIPIELEQFIEPIQKIINTEHELNKYVSSCYAYLTIDQSLVIQGETQRERGWHVDGFQGIKVREKKPICHSYMVSNVFPTLYSVQPFDTSELDPSKHNYFNAFSKKVELNYIRQVKPWDINLFDCYMFHACSVATVSQHRTFLRLTFDVREYDRMGNTINPLFDYKWDYKVQKNIPTYLI